MLPMIVNMKTTAIAAIAALSVALPAAPALAWGKKEQGFVAGVATAIIVDQLIEGSRARKTAPAPAPVYRPDPGYRPHDGYRPAPVATTSSIHATPAAQAFRSYSMGERKAIQRRLKASGYYYGGIDGSFGPGTYNAVLAFARDSGASGNMRSTGGAFAVYDGLLF